MQIEFDVDGQRLIRTSEAYIIEGSEFFVECLFSFSSDWDELEKWAIFKRGTDTYEILIVGNRCIVPVECTAVEGEFTISLIGRQSNMLIIATTSEKLLYVRSTSHSNISYFDKAMAYIKEKAEAAAAVLKSVLEAKDHIDQTDYKIYVGETAPTEDITNAMVWINPAEDDNGSDELAEAVTAAQSAATHAEVQAESVKKYKALWFDSVASMKAEPSLTVGAYVNTAGYYTPNDGGGASYLIRAKADSDTDDGGSLHQLSNGLIAELIIENGTVNVKQFGAVGNGETDDTNAIQNAINAANTIFPSGIFLVQTVTETTGYNIVIPSNRILTLDNNCTIKAIENNKQNYNVFKIYNAENICFNGGKIVGDRHLEQGEWGYGIRINASKNIKVNGVEICNCLGDGINVDGSLSQKEVQKDIYVNNCYIHNNRRHGISVSNVIGFYCNDCIINDSSGSGHPYCIDCEEDNRDTEYIDEVHISNLFSNDMLLVYNYSGKTFTLNNSNIKGFNISNAENLEMCTIGNTNIAAYVDLQGTQNVVFNNCTMKAIFLGRADYLAKNIQLLGCRLYNTGDFATLGLINIENLLIDVCDITHISSALPASSTTNFIGASPTVGTGLLEKNIIIQNSKLKAGGAFDVFCHFYDVQFINNILELTDTFTHRDYCIVVAGKSRVENSVFIGDGIIPNSLLVLRANEENVNHCKIVNNDFNVKANSYYIANAGAYWTDNTCVIANNIYNLNGGSKAIYYSGVAPKVAQNNLGY